MTEARQTTVSLRLVVIRSGHLEQVRTFYQALGIDLAQERHGTGPTHYAGQVGEAVFEVYPVPEGGAPDATTRLGFALDDVEQVVEGLRAAGATVLDPPRPTPWGYRAVVRDPDGRAVELYRRGEGRP
jgi:predicted enzyme related to lactoylglutathione lyase